MPTETNQPAEIELDEETSALFDKLLGARGEKWLTEMLKKLKPPEAEKQPQSEGNFLSFLQTELGVSRAEAKEVRETLGRLLPTLTPEQRELLTLPKLLSGENKDVQSSQTNKNENEPKPAPQKKGLFGSRTPRNPQKL